MDIQSRVVSYYKNNQFIQKYLKGIDTSSNEVLLDYNEESRRVSIDTLESIKTEDDLVSYFQGKSVNANIPTPNESLPNLEVASITPVSQEQNMLTDNVDLKKKTLDDIKILTELKNKEGLDNVLSEFAINQTTGLIDVNVAISTITRNTMNEVEKAIKNNYVFNKDLTSYDVQGNYTGTPIAGESSEDEQIISSFNNIKVYLDASKMYPEQVNYNQEQINNFMNTYITKVKEELHGTQGAVPVAEPTPVQEPEITPNVVTPPVQEVPQSANAGFADIFVLTVIILVYAAIIINLLLKIK